MCLYCFNHVKENMNGMCPACRTPYDDANYAFKPEPDRKNKPKRDPAQKEAEMAAAAIKVAEQQAQLRLDMISRAQQAQAAKGVGGGELTAAARQQQEMIRQMQAGGGVPGGGGTAAAAAGGSWAAMAGTSNGGGPPAPSSQAWPSLSGGSSAPAQGDTGDVDDWESLATGEEGSVPSLDDAKNNAEVAALMRQVSELQRKLQDAQTQLMTERTTREGCTEKCIAIRAQQVNFDAELMAMASKFQLESQAEGGSDRGAQSTADALAAVAPGAASSWRPASGLPPAGNPTLGNNDLWGGSSASSSFGGPAAGGFGAFGGPVATAAAGQAGLPGLSSIFGGSDPVLGAPGLPGLSGSADSSPWGSTAAVAAPSTGSSPWDMSSGSGGGGSALGGGIW